MTHAPDPSSSTPPSTSTPGPFLHVCEQAWGELRPRAVAVHLTLTATEYFSGSAAATKSEELRLLTDALVARGLADDAVSLAGANISVSTGWFTRSSSVTYQVRVHVTELELLPAVLEVVATSKQATLTHLAWDHGGGAPAELIEDCASRAAAKATRLASALGVELAGVHEVLEETLLEPSAPPTPRAGGFEQDAMAAYGYPAAHARRAYKHAAIDHELAGLDLAPTKPFGVRVRVAYRIRS